MTKEQFLSEWGFRVDGEFSKDLDVVIATEIAKVQEAQPTEQLEDAKPQPDFNPIEEAYERGDKIRAKFWKKGTWARKNSDTHAVDEKKVLWDVGMWDFKTKPEKWELYTEPTEQPSSQVKLDNSFDRERFEAMFRAVVASGRTERWEQDFKFTEEALAKLDAYYAETKGGNNG